MELRFQSIIQSLRVESQFKHSNFNALMDADLPPSQCVFCVPSHFQEERESFGARYLSPTPGGCELIDTFRKQVP